VPARFGERRDISVYLTVFFGFVAVVVVEEEEEEEEDDDDEGSVIVVVSSLALAVSVVV
jgi:hypothetical protein